MLQDIPTPTLREASSCVLETERLTLRRPTLADAKAIASLANDRRIAENTRRLPHPYLQDHAVEFVRATSSNDGETVFLIEQNYSPVGMVGIDRSEPDAPELGYWLGVPHFAALNVSRPAPSRGGWQKSRRRIDHRFLAAELPPAPSRP